MRKTSVAPRGGRPRRGAKPGVALPECGRVPGARLSWERGGEAVRLVYGGYYACRWDRPGVWRCGYCLRGILPPNRKKCRVCKAEVVRELRASGQCFYVGRRRKKK